MQTPEAVKQKIQSAQDLLGVVKTMKALAAVSIRQYQRSVESLAEYNRTVEMGLQIILKDREVAPERIERRVRRPVGAIVFGTDQGLCGQFNNVIAQHAVEELDRTEFNREDRFFIVIGMKAADILSDTGQNVLEILAQPGSTAGITAMVQDITLLLEDWRFRRSIQNMVLFYNEYLSGATYRPRTLRLLPVDQTWMDGLQQRQWDSRTLPIFTMDWERLFLSMIREYLFVSVYRAFANSLASENASRLAAMQNAEKNIEERLEELHVQFHRQRQMTITEELLDIVAGFEVLKASRA